MKNLFLVIEVVLSLIVIISILMQKSKADALSGLIQGTKTESYFSKNKSKTKESMLVKTTAISRFLFMINAVLLNII